MEQFLDTIKQIGIFMILAQGIMHFRKDGSYEKYFKLLISIMVIIQLAIPAISIFKEADALALEKNIEQLSEELFMNTDELNRITQEAQQKFDATLEQEIEQLVFESDNQVEIEKIEVIIDE